MMAGMDQVAEFQERGFVVLHEFFDPDPLIDEVRHALADGFGASLATRSGGVGNEFQYVPMMVARTPGSLGVLDALASVAADLLGRCVLPVRAKGTRYFGSTDWHRDSELSIPSIGFAAYLEPLRAATGALRVRPLAGDDAAGEAIATSPGDVIAFDEHLEHSSLGREAGDRPRLQWRVDFLADPIGADEEAVAREYFASIFVAGWDGGYDVAKFPSYDAEWRASPRTGVDRLDALGAYYLADVEEAGMRVRRR